MDFDASALPTAAPWPEGPGDGTGSVTERGLELVRLRGQAAILLAGLSEDCPLHDEFGTRGRRELDRGGPRDLSLVLEELGRQSWILDDFRRPRRGERSGDAYDRGLGRRDRRRQ